MKRRSSFLKTRRYAHRMPAVGDVPSSERSMTSDNLRYAQNPFKGTGAALLPAGKFLKNCVFSLLRNNRL